jgi:uncharacterized protein YceH (UPF0502 family)
VQPSGRSGRFAGGLGLTSEEVRVLGCLFEKQRTTPDLYPLTLNSLRLACNQSTNRDPVVDYDDTAIRVALHRLERRGFVRLASGRGSRAPKYRHLLAEALPMGEDEQALICVLMLRGAQTPGELKQRAERMHAFMGLEDVSATLAGLIERGLVERLGRRPGQKEERFEQLLEDRDGDRGQPAATAEEMRGALDLAANGDDGWDDASGDGEPAGSQPSVASLLARVERLEREMAELRRAGDAQHGGEKSESLGAMRE